MLISDWSSDVCSSDLREEIADLLVEIGARDREAIFLGGEFGLGQRHPRLSPTAEVEPLVDRNGGLGAIEARIGSGAREILDFDVHDWIEAETRLSQTAARGVDVGPGCDKRSEEQTSELQYLLRNSY